MKELLRITALIGMAAILAFTACAAPTTRTEEDVAKPGIVANPMNKGEDETDKDADNIPAFMHFGGTIVEIHPFADDQYYVLVAGDADADGYTPQVNFLVDANTVLLLNGEPEAGMAVIGFYDSSLPAPMIYPPQYTAVALVDGDVNGVTIDRFDEQFLSGDGSLLLHVSEETEIVFQDGTAFTGEPSELAGRALVVLYDIVTKSMPGQTTPVKIVVLYERAIPPIHYLTEEELAMLDLTITQVIVDGIAVDMPAPFIHEETGFVMVPVANIAEALGFAVYGEGEELMIGHGTTFTIGVDNYFYNRMASVQLGAAPELHDGVIFVPLSFFGDVFPAETYMEGGILFINSLQISDMED
ncbi:MAG: copper amine oxidase N-terminal domain-containing protein [Clostridiales bacterium]|nr:copper amine oxidase N-terminal domain-containing protein [Clostridiales bacterium]